MSQENMEALQRAIEAYNRGDRAAWVAQVHPDAKTFPTPDWPEQGPYIGGAEAWDFYEQAEEVWGGTSRPAPQEWEIIDAGDTLFAADPRSMAVRGSEARIEFKLYGVFRFRGGKIVRTQWFLDRAQALEAAGLSE